jgi:enterobactin synthetase component F
MSVPDMFLPLYSGGSLVIATNDEVRQPERIADLIRDREITLLQATPTVWRMILDSGWSGSPNLRAICGGEALDGVLRDRLALACKEAWNYYGPTEATVWCAAGQMIETRVPVTVGQAIAGMQLSVRDGDERPCAAGQAGELYIAGPGLARGYLGDSEQTAERFVHVQGDAESSRLYRSGDRAVCHANGEIEVLGRTDQQFKLRGYRIEAGEIEATAREHDNVSDVAVTQFMHESGKRMLVAWVQAKGGANLEHELRTYLVSRLPAFMIPARVVVLPELPRSPAGKVNRLALGKLGLPHHESALDTLPDWHPVARQLTALWRNILCLESVGPDEDFFELGGDSLQSLKLLAGIKDMTGRNLGIADLYAHATIRSLTELLDKGQEAGGLRALVPIRSVGSKTPIFFVHGQPYALAPYLEPDRPVYALHYYTHRRFEFENTVEAIADLYLGELRLVQPKGPYMLCGHCFGSMIVFEMARRLQAAGERVEWLGMIEPALLPALEHPWAKIRYVMALLPDRRFSFRNLLFLADRCTRSLAGRAMAVRRRIALVLSNWGARAPTSAARTAAILDRVTVARMGYHFEPLGIDGHLLMLDIDSREAERWIAAWQIYFKSGVQLHRVRGARAANVDLFERDNAAKLARIIDASIAHAEAPVGE